MSESKMSLKADSRLNKSSYIELGTCYKPHGIKGGFAVHLHNVEDSCLQVGSEVMLIPLSSESSIISKGEAYIISSISFAKKTIIYFDGISERNQVEKMLPFKLMIREEHLPQTLEGEFYINELMGMKVINEKMKSVGVVDKFYENGVQIVLVIACDNGSVLELPFVEAFFPNVDLKQRILTMNSPQFEE